MFLHNLDLVLQEKWLEVNISYLKLNILKGKVDFLFNKTLIKT